MKSTIIAFTLLVGVLLSSGGLLVTHASNSTYGSQIQYNNQQSSQKLNLNLQDEITRDTLLTQGGEVVNARVREFFSLPALAAKG